MGYEAVSGVEPDGSGVVFEDFEVAGFGAEDVVDELWGESGAVVGGEDVEPVELVGARGVVVFCGPVVGESDDVVVVEGDASGAGEGSAEALLPHGDAFGFSVGVVEPFWEEVGVAFAPCLGVHPAECLGVFRLGLPDEVVGIHSVPAYARRWGRRLLPRSLR